MSDLDDILLEGETVIWRGAPDIPQARKRTLMNRVIAGAIGSGLLLGAAAIFFTATYFDIGGFGGALIGLVGFIIGIVGLGAFGIASTRQSDDLPPGKSDIIYALTNQRLIQWEKGSGAITSIARGGCTYLSLHRNANLYGIKVGSFGEYGQIYLDAIPDGPAVERLIRQHLMPRHTESPS